MPKKKPVPKEPKPDPVTYARLAHTRDQVALAKLGVLLIGSFDGP